MLGFGSLWLQVLLVAVATFALSAVFWTAMPWHETELEQLPDEEAVRQVLLAGGATHGQFRIPYAKSGKDCGTPEMMQKFATGPVGIFQLQKPGPITMAPYLVKTFVLFLVIAFLTAYVLRSTTVPGAAAMNVFRLAFCVSFMAHAVGSVQDAIWFGKSWERVWKQAFDSIFFAAATGGIFAGMWPGVPSAE